MNYWLFKSEPGAWSWADQLSKGDQGEDWDGVRNFQAANNMKKMKIGDMGFFYHSVTEKRIVGIVDVIEEYKPDPTDLSKRFGMVKVRALQTLNYPVTLSDIKKNIKLSDLALIKQSRLSVVPLTSDHWKIICHMAKTSA